MRSVRPLAIAPLLGACGSASAHSPIPGIGHFYSGMLHPVIVPAHLMALVAMGLWLGQRWPDEARPVIAAVLAVPAGMTFGAVTSWPGGEIVILALTAVIAACAAAARHGPTIWRVGVAALLGIMLGTDSLPDGLSGRPLWLSLAGTWLGIVVALAWIAVMSEFARRPWMKIGLRVVASWVAAAAILFLALSWLGPKSKAPQSPPSGAGAAGPLTLIHIGTAYVR